MKGLTLTLLFFCPLAASYATPADTTQPAAARPIRTTLAAPLPWNPSGDFIPVRILNDAGLANYTNITLDWELRVNGVVRQKSTRTTLPLIPHRPATLRLPIKAIGSSGDELYLGLRYHYRNKPASSAPAPKGQSPNGAAPQPTLAEEQIQLRPWTNTSLAFHPNGELTFTDENGLFTIQSSTARLRFDKQTGWLVTYEVQNTPLLADTPGLKPHFWLGPGEPSYKPENAQASPSWQTASQGGPHLQLFSTSTGSQLVIIRTEYTLPETACLLHLSYTINATGEILVESSLEADSTRQAPHEPLPCFGMTGLFSRAFDTVTVYGPKTPADSTPYIYSLPATPTRESGYYPAVRRWTFTYDGKGLQLTADSALLAIGQNAGNRLTIDQSIPPYQLPYGNRRYTFKLTPVLPEEKITPRTNTRK
ncbi:MAG TPA: hypothetical protein VI233_12910 [Puia sp.]